MVWYNVCVILGSFQRTSEKEVIMPGKKIDTTKRKDSAGKVCTNAVTPTKIASTVVFRLEIGFLPIRLR